MTEKKARPHPYIPNSVPDVKAAMLREIGAASIDELYAAIPEALRFKGRLDLPEALPSEQALRRHVEGLLAKNQNCHDHLSFLGGGCWQHYVPAVCDEVNQRSEFLTAYGGEPYEDQGRFQALFEYESMMGELLDFDVVNVPTYDWSQAAATALRMAARVTGRDELLVPATTGPDRLAVIRNYNGWAMRVETVGWERATGLLDLEDLRHKLSKRTAAVYLEVPSYLGVVETQTAEVAAMAHAAGALLVAGVDPISLGVVAPPPQYGADLACGDIQPLGMHMQFGGGLAGFIASRDEDRFVAEFPSRLFGLTETIVPGERAFGDVHFDRTSFHGREHGKEFVGTAGALWGITAGVYLALMGPQGMRELGQGIMQRAQYAAAHLGTVPGVRAPALDAPFFKEFVVDFDGTGRTVAEVNQALLAHGIFGGVDLSARFPELGQSALFCVTEVHTKEDLDRLAEAVGEAVAGKKRRATGSHGVAPRSAKGGKRRGR